MRDGERGVSRREGGREAGTVQERDPGTQFCRGQHKHTVRPEWMAHTQLYSLFYTNLVGQLIVS